jgi:catechol 2,3-dioxygenase-like lactoylglutathione lyase family enzyme
MQLTTEGIHHATLVARDASATRRFYEDLLGVSLLERSQGTACCTPRPAMPIVASPGPCSRYSPFRPPRAGGGA